METKELLTVIIGLSHWNMLWVSEWVKEEETLQNSSENRDIYQLFKKELFLEL